MTFKVRQIRIYNDELRPFNVRLVGAGERYGLNDSVVHDDRYGYGPMVEFYDATYENERGFDARGQFVSRYYVTTLLEGRDGLCLDGSVRAWEIDESAMVIVRRWMRTEIGACFPVPR